MTNIGLDLEQVKDRDGVTVCVSGGLDSCVLLARLAEIFSTVYPIFVRNGHSWEGEESAALRRFISAIAQPSLKPLAEVTVPVRELLDRHWGVKGYNPGYEDGYSANFIPGRNIMLLSAVVMVAYVNRTPNVALGLLNGNPYPDAQPVFFRAFENMIKLGMNFDMRIITPLIHLEKEEVIKLGRDLPLELSLSCVNPQQGRHCGAHCNKCAERQKGFALANISDPTEYATSPPTIDWQNHQWSS
jgi:7-cyano-7-deazaguanine synthase